MVLNVTSRDAHVPDIERHIRTIKERARATLATLPFKALPPWLVIEMVYSSVFWLNAFPPWLVIRMVSASVTWLITFPVSIYISKNMSSQMYHWSKY